MAKAIRWTREALRTYVSIVRHLEKNWTQREIDLFNDELDSVRSVIAGFPRAFRRGEQENIHEALIKPWNLLIYRIHKNRIELLTFWDARRDPRTKPGFRRRSSGKGR